MDVNTLVPLFPIDLINRYRRIGIVAPENTGGKKLAQLLSLQHEFNGQSAPGLTASRQVLAGKHVDWEDELEQILQSENWEEHVTTVVVTNLSSWYSLRLGAAMLNSVYYGLSIILHYDCNRSPLPWFEELDYVFVRNLDDYHKRLVWLRLSKPFGGEPFPDQLSYEQFSALLDRYSEAGWLVINLKQDLQFGQIVYWLRDSEAVDKKPNKDLHLNREAVDVQKAEEHIVVTVSDEPTLDQGETSSYFSWMWSWLPFWK